MTPTRIGSRSLRLGAAGFLGTVLALAVVATGLVSPAGASAPTLTVGDPVLSLPFEDSLADAGASAHPVQARAVGGGTPAYSFVEGVKAGSKALQLGSNTYLDLGSSAELQPSVLTLSFWLRPSSAMSGEQVITWSKQAYNSDGWYLSSESNGTPLALSVGPGGGQPYKLRVASTDRAAFFPPGQWTHVAVTYDSASKEATFYRNGLRVPSLVANPTGGASTGVITGATSLPKTIGFNGPQYNGSFLTGALDDYQLFEGEATHQDVVTLYEQGGGELNKTALANADADQIRIPGSVTAAIALPAEGLNGSTISWQSSDTDVIGTDGTVHQPEPGADDAVVTLTATVRFADGDPVTRDFRVTVPAPRDSLGDTGMDVKLTDAYLDNAAAKEHDYLLSLSSKKFLFWFYKTAGLTPPTDAGYGGWENGNVGGNFRGHAFGHYMSALAMSYASTDDPEVKAGLHQRIVDAVQGLAEVQATYDGTSREGYISPFRDTALDAVEGRGASDDPVIVPYYNLHKVLAGLLDIDKYVDDATGDQALEVAEGFGEYLHGRVSTLADTSVMLRTEYGGMNDALYELYARSGGNPHFKQAAEAFDEVALFRDLAAGRDVLPGRHANTTIPKLIGALKRYTVLTQDPELYDRLTEQEKADLPMYLAAAQNFWQIVIDDHTYATGANSQSEHFHDPDSLHQFATQMGGTGNPQTAETCNEYNMLKLSRELFKLTQEVKYADYYENTFLNTIVSSQNPDTGMTTYFQAMAPGYNKLYALPFTDFWCCVGTGMENFSKLGDSIYFTGSDGLWVNMFWSSRVDHPATNLRLTQQANLPNDDTVRFTVGSIDGGALADGATVRLRVPDWIAGAPRVVVNGTPVTPVVKRGYVVLSDLGRGDVVDYTMPMEVRVSATSDDPDFLALKYGPALLSAGLGTKDLDRSSPVGIGVRVPVADEDAQQTVLVDAASVAAWKERVADNVVRVEDTADGQVQFALRNTVDGGDLRFTPHYRRHDERYGLYLNYEVKDSAASQARILEAKKQARELEFAIDSLTTFDNNNFENAKNVKSQSSEVGTFNGQQFRHAFGPNGWFSYDLEIDPAAAKNFLRARYYTGDNGRSFDVYLNDEKLKTERITNTAGAGVFYLQTDEIPRKYLDDPRWKVDQNGDPVLDGNGDRIPVVTVRFQSTGGFVGGLFGVHTTRPQVYDTDPALSALATTPGTLAPAFAPDRSAYTLTVPEGTERVSLDLSPHTPSGLVRVDDVLVDDTRPRTVTLAAEGPTTVGIESFAQDHETSTTYSLTIVRADPDPGPATSTTSLTAPSVRLGQTVHVGVRVRGDHGPATGTVELLWGERRVGSATLTSGDATIAVPAGRLGVGNHTLTARYSGDGTYDGSQGTAQVQVRKATSRTTADVRPGRALTSQRATVAVLVRSAVTATGRATVTVRRHGWTLVTRKVSLSRGRGTVLLPRLGAGRYRVTATYPGSTGVAASADSAGLRVVRRR